MGDGHWIKLHRKTLDSRVWSDAAVFRVWMWCLLSANWGDGWFMGEKIPAGSFVFGRNAAALKIGTTASSVYRAMKKLQSWGQIDIKSNNQFSVVSICNWSTYQESDFCFEQRMNNERTTSEQPANNERTHKEKNKKNKNRERESAKGRFSPPTPAEVFAYALTIGFTLDGERFCDYYGQAGWKLANGNPLRDWKAAVRTWKKREEDKKPKPFKQRLMTPEEELEWRP